MAMLKAIGFEYNSYAELDYYQSLNSTVTGRSGSYALQFMFGGIARCVFASKTELYIQFCYKYYISGAVTTGTILAWKSGSTVLGTLSINSNGTLSLYTGNSSSLKATGTKVISGGVFFVIELRIKIDDAAGVFDLRVDGISDASFTGDTKPGSETGIDTVDFIYAGVWHLDDIIINDTSGSQNNSWPSGAKVVLLKPNGAGSSTQWTPSTGSNYQTVDEVPPVITDQNNTNTADQLDLFALENLPAEAATIAAIQVGAWALKQGVTAVPNLKTAYQNSGGSPQLSSNHALSTSMALVSDIIEINPDTSAAFTPAEVNALEAGYKSAA